MTDAIRNYTRADGSFDLFDAIENGQRLQRQAVSISIRRLLARLFGTMRRPRNKLTVSTVDQQG